MIRRWLTNRSLMLNGRLIVSFVLLCVPQVTGIAFHEWLSLSFIVFMGIHLLKHWKWIERIPQVLIKPTSISSALKTISNITLYVLMMLVIVSGFLVSESFLPTLGFNFTISSFWSEIHHVTGNLIIPMLGIHLAQHKGWFKSLFKVRLSKKVVA